MRIHQTVLRRVGYGLLGLAMVLALSLAEPSPFGLMRLTPSASVAAESSNDSVQALLRQGKENFLRGRLEDAIASLMAAQTQAASQNDSLSQVLAWSNLGLVYGQLGDWAAADDAISSSLALLNLPGKDGTNWQRVRAQTLNVQGRLALGRGDPESAFDLWSQAAGAYQAAGDRAGEIRSQLRQARALQAMGFYKRAVTEILDRLNTQLRDESPSQIKAASLRSLAEALIVAESLDEARQSAQASLETAQDLGLTNEIAAAQLTLGNIAYAQAQEYLNQNNLDQVDGAVDQAQAWYRSVLDTESVDRPLQGWPSHPPENRQISANGVRSQLNQLALLIEFERTREAAQHWGRVYDRVDTLPPDRDGIYARINLADSLVALVDNTVSGAPSWEKILRLLETSENQADRLNDIRAKAHALGYLGKAYQIKGDHENNLELLAKAQTLTEEALFASETVNAADISYRWYEQLGDLHLLQNQKSEELAQLKTDQAFADKNLHDGHKQGAITAYRGAVNVLKLLRTDLAAINPEVQFSFQKSIEPLHRKLVDLLLEGDGSPNQNNLKDARKVLESLQQEELNNYLRAACLDSQTVSVDEVSGGQKVAVLYPIVLSDKIGVIANLPTPQTKEDKPSEDQFKFYSSSSFDIETFKGYVKKLRRQMVIVDFDVLDTAEALYNLLVPAGLPQDLADSGADTLVFIPDGILRSIPIGVLFDGSSYLAEKYSIAVTPGLELLNPQPLQQQRLTALTFGLSEAVEGWSPLPNVEEEIKAIGDEIPIAPYLNDEFTFKTFEETIKQSSAPIIHLATHGKFSSQLDDTFIQAWDQPITVNQLSQLLQSDRKNTLELLVLSACETALGDDRAALGLAGMAIRAGARSTLASLWQVDDVATSIFMTKFYEELATKSGNKAEALRNAQKFLIEDPSGEFNHPYYWAPFVLLGNWL